MIRFILARHGNTFKKEERTLWAGSKNDFPLVETGLHQARVVASCLKQEKITPIAIFCSSLQRTKNYALEILKHSHPTQKIFQEPIIDSRLDELDYGDWSGLHTDEIISQFGEKTFNEWDQFSKWPKNSNWGSSETCIIKEIQSFMQDRILEYGKENATILIISSNGRLRYFLKLIPNEFEKRIKTQTFKVATGHLCQIIYENSMFSILDWNLAPEKTRLRSLVS